MPAICAWILVLVGLAASTPAFGQSPLPTPTEPSSTVPPGPALELAPALGLRGTPPVFSGFPVGLDTAARRAGQESAAPPTPAHTGVRALLVSVGDDFRHLPSRDNLGWALLGAGFSLAVHPFDSDVNRHLYGKGAVHDFFLPGKILGLGYVQVGAALGTYAAGRVKGRPKVSHVGMDLLRAQILVGALTYGLKLSVRRERPDQSSRQSFPSGHASVTFATATALERHLGWRYSVPAYLLASYVAASRLHENRHFLSDVVAGAACGVIAGRTATRHGRSNYALTPVPTRGGLALIVSRQ